MKKKTVRTNEVHYMTKALRRSIATRSRLENRFHKIRSEDSKQAYKKQKKIIVVNYIKKKERNLMQTWTAPKKELMLEPFGKQ